MDTCADCRFNQEGYCVIYEKNVNPNSKPCPEFQEN